MAGKSSKARNKGRGVSAARPTVAEPEKGHTEAAKPSNEGVGAASDPTDISSGSGPVEPNSPEQALANGSVADKVETADAPPTNSKQNQGEIHLYPVPVKSQTGEKIELQLNPGDSVMDIRQFLLDAPETCFFTCYDLILHAKDGRVHHLEDYSEIAEVADITTGGCFIEMSAALYDDRSIRSHVRRARDLLSTGSHHASLSTLLALQNDTKQKSDVVKADLPELEGLGFMDDITGSLANLITSSRNDIACVDSIVFSSFNPPPSYRRLVGDLIYIDVTTLEGTKFCITGSTKSFYVNSSTGNILEPRPNKQFSEATTLIGLLQKLSSKFKKGFREILERKASSHPFENVQTLIPPNSWLAPHPTPDHKRDAARAEDAFVLSYGTELIGMQRDWNEELQSCREFPHNTLQERILRDRALYKVSCDFVDAAISGAIGVINGCISPINPTDPECFHMYVHNNIFFSFAIDTDIGQTLKDQASSATPKLHQNAGTCTNSGFGSQEESPSSAPNGCCQSTVCKSEGTIEEQQNGTHSLSDTSTEAQITDSEQATYASANNDLKGTKAYQEADVSGLYNLAMAIIDYRGHRIVAQSIIPGILQGDKSDSLQYGSVDNGKKISWNDSFHSKVLEAAKRLHIKEHVVLDGLGNAVKLAAPVECKGIVGSDGRHYILDLMRVTPRDVNYIGPGSRFCVLRPELVASFCQVETAPKYKTSIEEASVTSSDDVNYISSKGSKTDDNTVITEEHSNPASGSCSEEILLNPNVFTEFKIAGTEEEIASDEAAVRKAGSYLMDVVLPKFVQDLCSLEVSPMDGQTLTDALHAHGINIRYLGRVANMTKHLPHLWDLCTAEIIVRVAKHLLKEVLRESYDHELGSAITHFLNCFLGNVSSDAAKGSASNVKAQKRDLAHNQVVRKSARKIRNAITSTNHSANMFPTSDSLWSHIQEFSKSKYQFELPEDARILVKKVSVVRNLCLKVGISIVARKYDLDATIPFQVSDILNLQPVVKHSVPVSSEAKNLIENGKARLAEGMLNEAYTIFSEAFSLLQQVTGPMHREVANCCRYLAMVLYHAGDMAGAIMQQHKELIINERCLGLDHPDTAHSYGNMALFYHGLNQTELALRHMSRTLLLLSLSSGADHPDVAATFINVAMMYQDIGKMNTALRYLQEALKKNERLLGPEHIQTAVCYHALAIAFNCMGAYKLSHQHEKKTYDIFVKQLGEEDSRTRDAENWIKTFKMRDLQVNAQKQKAHSVSAESAQKAIDLLKAHPDLLQAFQAAATNSSAASLSEVLTKGRGVDLRAARATAELRKRAAAKGLVRHGTPVQVMQPLSQLLDIINAGATPEAVNDTSADDLKKQNNHDTTVSENGFSADTQDHKTSLESKKDQTPAGLTVGLKRRNPNKKLQHD